MFAAREFFVIALAVPATLLIERWFLPRLAEDPRTVVLIVSFLLTYPLYIIRRFLYFRGPALGPGLIMLGIFIRLTGLAGLSLWLRIAYQEQFRSGLLLYLTAMGCFLFFEIAGLIATGLELRPLIRKNED